MECITYPVDFDDYYDFDWGQYDGETVSTECLDSPSSNYDLNPSQVFKRTSVEYNDEDHDLYVWGYDEDYALDGMVSYDLESTSDSYSYLNLAEFAEPDWSGIRAELAQIRNNEYYYILKVNWGSNTGCFAHSDSTQELTMRDCNREDPNQLYKVHISEDQEAYGALSIEKDSTPPSKVTNFTAQWGQGVLVDLSWDASKDDRIDAVEHYELEKWDSDYEEWEWVDILDGVETSYEDAGHPVYTKYRIRAIDYAENKSSWTVTNLS